MEIDFYKEFANYSTAELLLITREPDKYQPAAIEAAELLLQRRVITPVDAQEADRQISAQADAESVRLKRMNSYKEQVAEVLEPVIVPNTTLDPAKWFKLFLWSYGLYYAWVLYKVVKTQVLFFGCENCKGYPTVWGGVINAIFLTIVFFFLLKNKRWGWIFLIVSNIGAIITLMLQLLLFYKYRDLLPIDPLSLIIAFGVPVLYVLFLWRPSIAVFFGVDVRTKRRSAWVGIAVGLLYCGIIEWVL
jgi:hypothetical protein